MNKSKKSGRRQRGGEWTFFGVKIPGFSSVSKESPVGATASTTSEDTTKETNGVNTDPNTATSGNTDPNVATSGNTGTKKSTSWWPFSGGRTKSRRYKKRGQTKRRARK